MMKRRPSLPPLEATAFTEIVRRRYNRRDLFSGALGGAAALSLPNLFGCAQARVGRADRPVFESIAASGEDRVRLAAGYTYDLLLRWGDPIFPGARALEPRAVTQGALLQPGAAADQERQFGYNCDAVQYFALPGSRDRGMLAVNNEFTTDELMYPGARNPNRKGVRRSEYVAQHPQVVAYSLAAHGVSIVEIARAGGKWRAEASSSRNRRITGTTLIELSGPAAGSDLLKTAADSSGRVAAGTFGNCAGGRTPWATYLTAEENVYDYFGDRDKMLKSPDIDERVKLTHRRFRTHAASSLYGWEAADGRFSLLKSPTEALRFGWIVEIDPLNPTARPRKRTALGRFAHECATTTLTRDGRVAVYMGDDERFEYLYKFVSRDRFDPLRPERARDLLGHGTLYTARLDSNGKGQWLPLVHEAGGPFDDPSWFRDQGEVLINTRAAADRLGATPMDRPEDIEIHPLTGRVYIACTKNADRVPGSKRDAFMGREIDIGVNAANPRPDNRWGHIVELIDHDDDAGSRTFDWNIFLLGGDPARGRLVARYEDLAAAPLTGEDVYYAGQAAPAPLASIGSPDNLAFDRSGNLWIVTDGDQPEGGNNGCFMCPTEGPHRGELRRFMTAPAGAEICGCSFSPEGDTLFLSIQHPGEGGTLTNPVSHWPDGPGCVARPSVIAVRREDGGPI
jgi:hypothetical protein